MGSKLLVGRDWMEQRITALPSNQRHRRDMRQKRTAQATTYELFANHELEHELQAMSARLDAYRGVLMG